MDGVCSEVDGTVRPEEVVQARSKLWGKVPDTSVGCGAVGELIVNRPSADGRIFVIRPDKAAPSLNPGNNLSVAGAGEVPAQENRSDGSASVGSSDLIGIGADTWGGTCAALELWAVGLPEGKDLDGVFEVAVQNAGADVGGENLASVAAEHEELEVVSVFGDAEASLGEDAQLKGAVRGGEGGGCGGFRLRSCRGRGEKSCQRDCAEG